jgi:enoyl-CoA hydratase/carnithine racemase
VSPQSAVVLERRGAIAVLTLNRSERANTFNGVLLHDLHEAKQEITEDPSIRVVILTGAGRHFSGGADLREKRTDRRDSRARYPRAMDLSELPQPVIAAINGPAMGGGCEIALTCDFRFMARTATIGLTEIRFGALPVGGGTARLARAVGVSWAKKMIMTGDPIDAEQAERIGLVDWVVEPEDLMRAAEEFAGRLTERADYALRTAKALLNTTLEVDLETALELERTMARSMATREQHAAARSDAARRMPTYAKIFSKREDRIAPSKSEG